MDIEATMILAAVSEEKPEASVDAYATIERLQLEQFQHDEKYHREIARLTVQDRLKHMALHFAKYSGNLAEAQAKQDETEVQRVATDVFIIGMSTANILNFRLGTELSNAELSARDLGEASSFAARLAIGAGKMAAACEKLDHLEDFPFRPVIRGAAVDLVHSAIIFAEASGWDLEHLVRLRLKPIKEKFIHHGRV